MERDCRKWLNNSPKSWSPHAASLGGTSEDSLRKDTIEMFIPTSVDKFAKLQQYQEPVKSASTSITTFAKSGKCLV